MNYPSLALCNHTSVGIIVRDDAHRVLMIERRNAPYGIACPAGHVENEESYETAARRELREEVGLVAVRLELQLDVTVDLACRRPCGDWHRWKVYEAQAEGSVNRDINETKGAAWYDLETMQRLAQKTEHYRAGTLAESDWQEHPGLEPVWYDFFHTLRLLDPVRVWQPHEGGHWVAQAMHANGKREQVSAKDKTAAFTKLLKALRRKEQTHE